MGASRQPHVSPAPPSGQPDFVLRDDGELVSTHPTPDLEAEAEAEEADLVGDLVLDRSPPSPASAPGPTTGSEGAPPPRFGPPRSSDRAAPIAPRSDRAAPVAPRTGRPAPPREPPPRSPPPRFAAPDDYPIPEAQASATPTILGTPLPELEVPAARPPRRPPPVPAPDPSPTDRRAQPGAAPCSGLRPSLGDGRSPPPTPRSAAGTDDTHPISSNDVEMELDDRSLADIAFESSTNLPVLESHDVDTGGLFDRRERGRRERRPPPPAPRGGPQPTVHGLSPSGPEPAAGRAGAENPSGFRPRAQARPVRERARGLPSRPSDASGGNDPALSLSQKAELLYQEALKEISAGDLAAARRHLQLALSFSPRHPQYTRALQSLKGR